MPTGSWVVEFTDDDETPPLGENTAQPLMRYLGVWSVHNEGKKRHFLCRISYLLHSVSLYSVSVFAAGIMVTWLWNVSAAGPSFIMTFPEQSAIKNKKKKPYLLQERQNEEKKGYNSVKDKINTGI